MHVLQYIAVQADNEDEAMRTVEDTLNHELGIDEYEGSAWYDWFVVGGGRFTDGDPYQSSPNNVISYKGKPEEFLSMVDSMISNRKEEFNRYRKTYDENNTDISTELDKYDGDMLYDFKLYDLSKMIDMIQGKWDFNSYFYDIHNQSTNTKWMKESIDKQPDVWYLIPVDFHF